MPAMQKKISVYFNPKTINNTMLFLIVRFILLFMVVGVDDGDSSGGDFHITNFFSCFTF